jgi:hypothetical protein
LSLFDPAPFEGERREPDGEFQIQMWDPNECVWTPGPTCPRFSVALTTAFEWLDAGWVLHPSARIVNLGTGKTEWQSRMGAQTVVPDPRFL